MGLDPATLAVLIPALGQIGGATIGGALAPNPFQPRQSFHGTTADPVASATNIQSALSQILGPAMAKAMTPADLPGPDMSHAVLPSFTGGGLPQPIGVTSGVQANPNGLPTVKPRGAIAPPLFGPTVGGQTRGPGNGEPDPTDPANPGGSGSRGGADGNGANGPGSNSPGNGNNYLDLGPKRRYTPTTIATAASDFDGSGTSDLRAGGGSGTPNTGGLDPSIFGAVQLLMHAAQGHA